MTAKTSSDNPLKVALEIRRLRAEAARKEAELRALDPTHPLLASGRPDPAGCLTAHSFAARDGWRMVCASCDHPQRADCHRKAA